MKDVFFTIIIKDTDNLAAIDAIKRQNWNNFECLITNNFLPGLKEYIGSDNRFRVIENKYADKYANVNIAIEQGNGEYFIIINYFPIFRIDASLSVSFAINHITMDMVFLKGFSQVIEVFFRRNHTASLYSSTNFHFFSTVSIHTNLSSPIGRPSL